MLALEVCLADESTRAQQRAGDRLLLLERDARRGRDPIGRSAARDQRQHHVLSLGPIGKLERLQRGGDAGRIGERVTCLDHRNEPGRPAVTMTGDGHPGDAALGNAVNIEIMPLRHFGHGARRLAGGQHDQPALRRRRRKMRRQTACRMRGGDCGLEQGLEKFPPRTHSFAHSRRLRGCLPAIAVPSLGAAALWRRRAGATILGSIPGHSPDLAEARRILTMKPDDANRTNLEAAVFRRLVEHLRARTEVQNLDLMNLAGFCRNCLSNWMKEAADAEGIAMTKDESRELVYGMPYEEWKTKYQREASPQQRAAFEAGSHKH